MYHFAYINTSESKHVFQKLIHKTPHIKIIGIYTGGKINLAQVRHCHLHKLLTEHKNHEAVRSKP